MKKLALSLIVFLVFVPFLKIQAQLYSNGNNVINGNYVGIGKNTPSGVLHIYNEGDADINGGVTYDPLIRLHSVSDPLMSPVTNYYWDFKITGSSALSFWQHSNSNSEVKVFELNTNAVKINTKLIVNENAEYGEGFTPNGSQGFYLSLGLKQLGTTGAWQGSGATLFTTSTGEFQIMTNPTGVVSGASNMTNQIRFMAHHSGVSINSTTLPAGYSFSVKGDAIFDKVVVRTYSTWPDYVFTKNYNLRSLTEVKTFITQNGHLPEVPSAKQVKEEGIDVVELNAVLLKKIEELTLYLLELEARMAQMEANQ